MTADLLEQRFAALADHEDDSDWAAIQRRRRRPAAVVLAVGVLVLATIGVGAGFALYDDVLPFGSQPAAPTPVVRDFQTLFGGQFAPPGMDPHVLAGEARRVATYGNGRHRYVLYLAPTKTGDFCESFTHLFGGCRQTRTPGAPDSGIGEVNPFAIGEFGEMSARGAIMLAGDLLLPPGTTLTVELADGTSAEIPVTFVSPPIDAGFFLYPVPAEHIRLGHDPTYLTARDPDGHVVSRSRVCCTNPHGPPATP
jgi:hypothetical protein